MTAGIAIRTCTTKDIGTLLALGIRTFRDTFSTDNTPENMRLYLGKTFTPQQLEKEFSEEGTVFFLAVDGDQHVGYAKVRASEKPEALNGSSPLEIERIYAIQEYFGKKIGHVLMETCLDYAKRNGFDTVWLGVWEHNPRAIAFYEKWGFEKFGQHPFMLGNDLQTDLLMKKKIK